MQTKESLANLANIVQQGADIIDGLSRNQQWLFDTLDYLEAMHQASVSILEDATQKHAALMALETRYDHGEPVPGPRRREDSCRFPVRQQAERLERLAQRVEQLRNRERASWNRAPNKGQTIMENSGIGHLIREFVEDVPRITGIRIDELPEVSQ
tara:strand:+ start:3564 stop:4028 length:465 start_codon:yes stop_codon:yes gene_type:complete